MEAVVQSSQQHALTEDSSDRSESSTMSQEYQIRGFESYEIVKRLNLAVGERGIARDEPSPSKTKDFRVCVESASSIKQQHPHNHHHHHHHHHHQESGLHLDEVNENLRELAVSMGKSKELSFDGGQIGEALGYQMDSRASDAEVTTMETSENPICRTKEQLAATKEAFQARQKYINASFDRSPKRFNSLVEREIKEYGLAKGYNLPLERMKEFNLPLDRMRDCHMTVLPRERLAGIGLLENSRILEGSDHRNFHVQSRSPHLETMAYERMRRSQHHLLNQMDFTAQNLVGSQLPHGRQSIASQIQQSHQQQQQQQQQPQIKSFTIDAILAHRNNQKERHRSQQQQLRKAARQECQEVALKSGNGGGSSITGSNANGGSNGSGKAKRVRTIFTAEQLERLEGEFARQQYMVGPERLYLAHALRLTEAQVKVWFQNRRIKWRKVNHEQQCLAVSEHRQRCTLPSLEIHEVHEDESNENNAGKWCGNSGVPSAIAAPEEASATTSNTSSPSSQIRELRELRPSPIVKP